MYIHALIYRSARHECVTQREPADMSPAWTTFSFDAYVGIGCARCCYYCAHYHYQKKDSSISKNPPARSFAWPLSCFSGRAKQNLQNVPLFLKGKVAHAYRRRFFFCLHIPSHIYSGIPKRYYSPSLLSYAAFWCIWKCYVSVCVLCSPSDIDN